jgi:TPR repeat protein
MFEKNYSLAFSVIRKAAKQKSESGYFHLGIFFESGIGIPRNISKAIHCFSVAAEMKNTRSMEKLGLHYLHIVHEPKSIFQIWFRAANQESVLSRFFLSICYIEGFGCKKNYIYGSEVLSDFSQHVDIIFQVYLSQLKSMNNKS